MTNIEVFLKVERLHFYVPPRFRTQLKCVYLSLKFIKNSKYFIFQKVWNQWRVNLYKYVIFSNLCKSLCSQTEKRLKEFCFLSCSELLLVWFWSYVTWIQIVLKGWNASDIAEMYFCVWKPQKPLKWSKKQIIFANVWYWCFYQSLNERC